MECALYSDENVTHICTKLNRGQQQHDSLWDDVNIHERHG